MELEIFQFIHKVLERLDEMKIDLDIASREIEEYFEAILEGTNEGYLNMNSRVKSKHSLKEKILRYDYYKKYQDIDVLYQNLSDLIGVRIECRFVEDETAIYRGIKHHFNIEHEEYRGYYYNNTNPHMLLELGSKQPKNQKNGVKIYRIDGKYICNEESINFELQIKSLINIFWSEIEHKIIYKNYNYTIADKFYKDIMSSIKNSLTTIDQQLLLISNQFDRVGTMNSKMRKGQVETLLSKVIYDLFAVRMKNDIGILVDFRKSCDTIVKYVFREVLETEERRYNATLVMAMDRLSDIDNTNISFDDKLKFERELNLEDEFSQIIGTFIKGVMNEEFQWNLFFRILFHIEPESNARDLENFIEFYKYRISDNLDREDLEKKFEKESIDLIVEDLMVKFAEIFVKVNKVELLYDNIIEQIIKIFNRVLEEVNKNVKVYKDWENDENIYLQLLELSLMSMLNINIEATEVLDFLEDVRNSDANINIHKSILKNIDKL
ncbi:MAG: hypothetical protein RR324_04590 [Cellulosilyticaceae bacterium]